MGSTGRPLKRPVSHGGPVGRGVGWFLALLSDGGLGWLSVGLPLPRDLGLGESAGGGTPGQGEQVAGLSV